MKIEISVLTSLYKCEEYLKKYFTHVEKIVNLAEVEFIFIHNDPTEKEKEIIDNFLKLDKINYQYIEVPREGLYKSWNRGIKMAKGDFIAVWNVDDVRYPESLLEQKKCLLNNQKNYLAYGKKYISRSFDDTNPKLSNPKAINNKSWFKKFQDGSLIMWKKRIHDEIGYFDEQFISLGDQDFWYRAVKKHHVVKCDCILGTFLAEAGKGISKSSNIPSVEKIIIGLRYGFFTYFNPWGWKKALKNYDVAFIFNDNDRIKVPVLRFNHFMIYLYSLRTFLLSFIRK